MLVTTVQQLGGELRVEASRVREQHDNDETMMDTDNLSEAEQAVDFLAKSDMKNFGSLLAQLKTSYTRGIDGYPITLASSFDMVVNYKDPSKYPAPTRDANEDGMSFFIKQDGQCTPQGQGYGRRGVVGQSGHGSHGCGSICGCGLDTIPTGNG